VVAADESGEVTVPGRGEASDLMIPTTFNFWILSDSDFKDDNSHIDYAPDAHHGTWQYTIKIAAPAAAPASKPAAKAVPKCKKGQKSTAKKPCKK